MTTMFYKGPMGLDFLHVTTIYGVILCSEKVFPIYYIPYNNNIQLLNYILILKIVHMVDYNVNEMDEMI